MCIHLGFLLKQAIKLFSSCSQTDQDKENFQKLVNAIKESKSVSMSIQY